jgi:glycosyltransferase involved in cell wall biosynthesis
MNQEISVFIIAYNEEAIIAKCLEKLHWASEIIVVDSGSTDTTVAICEKFGAKVIFNAFENFGKQKQFALLQTSNRWVLSLDADEVLSDELITEIKNTIFTDLFSGYTIPTTHVFLNKVFKYGNENKRPILRLFDKEKGCFQENKVHEKIIIDGKIGSFKKEMLHYTVFEISIAARKMINYALLSGEFLYENAKTTSMIKPLVKFPFDFFRVYWVQLNFLNGYQGFLWSIFSAFGSFLKYAKLFELQNKSRV